MDVITERQVFDPGENFEPPPCRVCTRRTSAGEYIDLMEAWLAGPEPPLGCKSCGGTFAIGDWRWHFSCAVGNLAVRFADWPILDDRFVEEIGVRLSGRWALILGHY